MLNILIVDDIHWIRKGIRALLEPYVSDCTFLEANDGEEALGLVRSSPVDLVIADVRMPNRDGISLLQEIRSMGLDMPYLVISGYSEFKYAEQALNLGACGYLLKPVDAQQLYDQIDKALARIRQSSQYQTIQADAERMRAQLETSQQQEELRLVLFEGRPDLAESVRLRFFKPETTWMALAIINITSSQAIGSLSIFSDPDLVRYCIRNISEEVFQDFQPVILPHPTLQQQVLVLLGHPVKDFLSLEKDRLSRQIVEHAANYLNSDLAIGTSLVQAVLGPDLLLQAQRAIQTRFSEGNRGVYRFETIGEQDAKVPVEELKLLERYLQRQDLANARQILDNLFVQSRIGPAVSVYTQHICRTLLDLLVREFGARAYDLVEPEFIQVSFLDGLDSPQAIAQRIYDNLAKVVRGQATPPASGANLIEQITAYMAEHYQEDISLKHLADTFAINYSYLSTLFKQETGQSVVNYLTRIRLERASHLLQTTTADIATIAEMTGYSDLNYFYRLFKKHFGLTPLSYRNQKNIQ